MRLRMSRSDGPRNELHRRRAEFRALVAFALATFTVVIVPAQVGEAATLTVANCNDAGAGSLRQAVLDASTGDTITFGLSPSCNLITLTTGPILIDKSVDIVGPGQNELAVSGGGTTTVLYVESTVTISGLTIDDGAVPVTTAPYAWLAASTTAAC